MIWFLCLWILFRFPGTMRGLTSKLIGKRLGIPTHDKSITSFHVARVQRRLYKGFVGSIGFVYEIFVSGINLANFIMYVRFWEKNIITSRNCSLFQFRKKNYFKA